MVAPKSRDSKAERLIDEADRLYVSKGRSTKALNKINQALRLVPDNTEALIIKGRILRSLNQGEEAMKCYTRAIVLDPSSGEGFVERASFLYGRDNKRALREVRKAISRSGKDRWVKVRALRLQGHILGELNQEHAALLSYRRALRVDPKDPDSHWDVGGSLLVQGQPTRSLRHFEAALRLSVHKKDTDQEILGLHVEAAAVILNDLRRHEDALWLIERGLGQVRDKRYLKILRELRDKTRQLVRRGS